MFALFWYNKQSFGMMFGQVSIVTLYSPKLVSTEETLVNYILIEKTKTNDVPSI